VIEGGGAASQGQIKGKLKAVCEVVLAVEGIREAMPAAARKKTTKIK
jgi:hypothetical protein